ncbi:uncharacterized protein K460DRAFT_404082 [Cucurbitaria berberidis CBS 394.84]|uniref:Uncharacterized protein n=1 Tax=Cucurbitaria berberidis CBS 394.84 TaxID=1168544 RepID=A0A9P4GPI2_9PLEO|nr:uncharacterized protein K460DRAFT_404082 [Cucurbitaria berberidis CBS 394.84]KAF1848815.1 hypothetical protein K460DRAFT_404082 [Cucurbitaria berberidis CBS 394.84]
MTTPPLSAPTLFTPSELRADAIITASITRLVNDAFLRSHKHDPVKWDCTDLRFATLESYYQMLGEKSVVALIFDDDTTPEEGKQGLERNRSVDGKWAGKKVVACATAVPWKGGWTKEGAETERGWEMKAVCVDGSAKYARRGLAVQLLQFLEQRLINIEQSKLGFQKRVGENEERAQGNLNLWILAAECLNGDYWRKRGYQEVRRSTQGAGVWGCQTSFEIVVLRKDVPFELK